MKQESGVAILPIVIIKDKNNGLSICYFNTKYLQILDIIFISKGEEREQSCGGLEKEHIYSYY